MMDTDNYKTWKELSGSLGEDYITEYVSIIYRMAKVFYERMDIRNRAFFDEEIFDYCMIDTLYDLKRLKEFHEVDNISYERLLAYAAGWIIKRKPFQMIKGYETHKNKQKYKYINEKFAFTLLMEAVGFSNAKYRIARGKGKKIERLLNRVLYHLRYRNSDPRTLELLVYGIETGMLMERS